MPAPEPLGAALFLVLAMSMAGVVHVFWLKSRWSLYWQQPLDGNLHWRGRRLFGPHKMLRGLMVLPLAAALTFLLFSWLRPYLPELIEQGMWPLSPAHYAALGFVCGLAFMLAELPNSFLKRQLDIGAGQAAHHPLLRRVFLLTDRCDSELGVLLVVSLLLPVTVATWGWTLLLGAGLHAGFSYLLYVLGVKGRVL